MDVKNLDSNSFPSIDSISSDLIKFPSMRYLGSKRRLLPYIYSLSKDINFKYPLDLYCGTGAVSWMFKNMGKSVTSNDALMFPSTITQAITMNPLSSRKLNSVESLAGLRGVEGTTTRYYNGIFFEESDCKFLDAVTKAVLDFPDDIGVFIRASLAISALKKRPRGLFTQAHHRSTRKGALSNENLPLRLIFKNTVKILSESLVAGSGGRTFTSDSNDLEVKGIDFLYLDPPYPSKLSDANYLRRYHFLEGLCRDWIDVDIDFTTTTRQVRVEYPRVDDSSVAIYSLRKILERYRNATWMLSLNSNSIIDIPMVVNIFRDFGRSCKVYKIPLVASVATKKDLPGVLQNRVDEIIFLSEVRK